MKKLLLILLALSAIESAHADMTATTQGNTTYFNDGSTATTQGNTTYFSDGSTATTMGNTTYYNDYMAGGYGEGE